MDRTDLALCKLLLLNSRTPVRELGDKLGLSIAAVHARIEGLRRSGIIKSFTGRLDLVRLRATIVVVWGTTRLSSTEEVITRMERDEHVYWVTFGGAGSLYVAGYLRSLTELDGFVSYVTKEAGMADATVGLVPMGAGLPEEPLLDRLDARIIRAMHRDARKPIADIAEEIGISAKTVTRRLARMKKEGSVEFSMDWYPDATNDIICLWHMDIRPGADRAKAEALLMNRYGGNLLFTMPMSNLPRFLLAATWTPTTKELKELQAQFRNEEPFERVVPNVIYTGVLLETWRDALLMKWAGPKERAG